MVSILLLVVWGLELLPAGGFIALSSRVVEQGESFSLLAWQAEKFEGQNFRLRLMPLSGGKSVTFRVSTLSIQNGTLFHAVLAMDLDAKPGKYLLEILQAPPGRAEVAQTSLDIAPRNYPLEEIMLDASMTSLRTKPDPKKAEESRILTQVLDSFPGDFAGLSTTTVLFPVNNPRQTSFFGEMRRWIYSNGSQDSSHHLGIDYGGDALEVRAMASGRVVFAGLRILTGNTVVVEHSPGLMSLHYHLSEIRVAKDQVVIAGQLLGSSGKTGLVTGPHLHWELRAQLVPADPLSLDDSVCLDKRHISSILSMSFQP